MGCEESSSLENGSDGAIFYLSIAFLLSGHNYS